MSENMECKLGRFMNFAMFAVGVGLVISFFAVMVNFLSLLAFVACWF